MKIVFFYPSYVLGGAELLITRLVNYLGNKHECYIVDYADGIYRELSKSLDVNCFIEYKKHFLVPNNSYIVTFPSELNKLYEMMDMRFNNLILVWAVHADNFQSLIPMKRFIPQMTLQLYMYPKIKNSIEILCSKKSLVLLHGAMPDRYRYLYGNIEKTSYSYCSVPITTKNKIRLNHQPRKTLKFAWLGRLSSEKVYSLLKVLQDLDESCNTSVVFDIIGQGESDEIIKNFIPKNNDIKINFCGTIIDELDEILITYDIIFGMGTSVLEGSKLGVPTIIVDASYTPLPIDYKYRWVYESKDHILAYILPNQKINSNNLTITDIITVCKNKDIYNEISSRCYKHTIKFHSLPVVSECLIAFLKETSFSVQDIGNLSINLSLAKKIHNVYKNLESILRKEI